jgi:hypothetical protein
MVLKGFTVLDRQRRAMLGATAVGFRPHYGVHHNTR